MTLDKDACYRALLTHDTRFDGTFFVGVSTTGIYCRTVCTARTPRREHCSFYRHAVSAEKAGFRPCLRCRPELSPGSAHSGSVSRLAAAIAGRIEEGDLAEIGMEQFASELGVSARHLRRVLKTEMGVSPVELAQSCRLLLAKQLLTDTSLPVSQVAFASGFSSVRRLNALFQARYRLNPSTLRRARRFTASDEVIRCSLTYRPPYAWGAMMRFLDRRGCPGVESVTGDRYLRTVCVGECRGWLAVQPDGSSNRLAVEASAGLASKLAPILSRVKRLFDLAANPLPIAEHLGPLAMDEPGLRVPGAFQGFEIAAAAILSDHTSVEEARDAMGRLAVELGERIETPFAGLTHLFPSIECVAHVKSARLRKISLPTAASSAIQALAKSLSEGGIALRPGPDAEATAARMAQIDGITACAAEYIAMRALSWPDAFPQVDLAPESAAVMAPPVPSEDSAEKWRPWRAYAAMHLWNNPEKKQ